MADWCGSWIALRPAVSLSRTTSVAPEAHFVVQNLPQKKLLFLRKILKTKDRNFSCLLDLWFLR